MEDDKKALARQEQSNETDIEESNLDNEDALLKSEEDAIEIGMSDKAIADIQEALHEKDQETLNTHLKKLNIPDTAELLHKINDDDRANLLAQYGEQFDSQIFAYLDPNICKKVLSSMKPSRVARIIAELESDDALNLIENLDENFQKEIIRKLSAKTRIAIEEGLTFPEDSAGRLTQREYVAIPQFWTVGKVIDYLRAAVGELPESFSDLIIINPSYHVVGEVLSLIHI